MSQSTIVRRNSSPCCIGCVVLVIICLGFFTAFGIYFYKFAKKNISLLSVGGKQDPSLSTAADLLLPQTVGEFERKALTDSLEHVPEMADVPTSSAHIAVYEDGNANSVTVIAVSSVEAKEQRQQGFGLLTMGRGKANASDTGISIRDPFSGDVPRTIVTWSKPNWTFMVQTTSTLASTFVEDFLPGGVREGEPGGERPMTSTMESSEDGETTGAVRMPSTETEYN